MALTKKSNKKTKAIAKGKSAKTKRLSISVTPPRLKKASSAKDTKLKSKSKGKTIGNKLVRKISKPQIKTVHKKNTSTRPQVRKVTKIIAAPIIRRKKVVSYPKHELNHFRELINQKIREANDELAAIEERLMDTTSGEYTDEDSTYSMHMAEQGTDAMEREKSFLFAARERKFISHLEDALQRIASGNYGVCINCGSLIDKGRLEAVPHARMCVDCKNDSKKGEST